MSGHPSPMQPAPAGAYPKGRHRWKQMLPQGGSLPFADWKGRHRVVLALLWLHVPALAVFGLWRGQELPSHILLESALLAVFPLVAMLPGLPRRARSILASLGLITASALLTHLSGGYIEAHFHFFAMLGIIVMYEDWIPFGLAILYVAVHHGAMGTLVPGSVYNHPAAFANPWLWGAIHAFFVLGLSVALVIYWRMVETARSRTKRVLDSAGEGIMGIARDGTISFANPAAGELTGHAPADLVGRGLHEFLNTPATHRGPATNEEWLTRAHGPSIPVEWNATPAQGDDDQSERVIVFRDVSQRKRAEAELQSNLSLLEATLDSTADGVLVVDGKGKITRYNSQFARMWRIPEEVLARQDDEEALANVLEQLKDPAGFIAKMEKVYAHPEETSFDVLEFKDERVFERHSNPQRIGTEVVGRVWSFHDATRRVKAEQSRREAEMRQRAAEEREYEIARLKELDRFKTEFINITAHELKTPLTPIKIQLHLLHKQVAELEENARVKKTIDVLERNINRLDKLIEDELEIVRLNSGRIELKLDTVHVHNVAGEVVESFSEMAQQKGITLENRVDAGVRVRADEPRLVQVLYNLVSNALKCTPAGGRVFIDAKNAEQVHINVHDSGIGITKEEIQRLFQPFGQIHQDQHDGPQGIGLGLYISRSMAILHGGVLEAHSQGPGKGSTFTLKLPLQGPSAAGSVQAPMWRGDQPAVVTTQGTGSATAHGKSGLTRVSRNGL